jgi:SAM-dependent methyltransferase
MPTGSSPFVDPALVRGALYRRADRLARRSGALHRAKTRGRYAPHVITDLAAAWAPARDNLTVADVGCGRGSSTLALADHLTPPRLLGIDLSPALLVSVRERLRAAGHRAAVVCADFHRLPAADASCDLLVAAFCLYHSPRPEAVVSELARCLASDGVTILVTKSEDSYRELDTLVAHSGLDRQALVRPSLYAAAHSGNLPELAATALEVRHLGHEQHTFRFSDLDHVADYLATSPKYTLPPGIAADPVALATALRDRLPDEPITTASTVTYLVARRRPGSGRTRRHG